VEDWGDLDGTALLVDEPQQAFSERVQLEDLPRVRLLPDGPDLDGGYLERVPRPLVVVDPTPWPRVVLESYDLQVLVYVERDALQSRVVAQVDGTGPDGDGLVRLAPGLVVDPLGEDGARVQVHASVSPLEIEAWLPRSAVDEVWPERASASAFVQSEGTTRSLPEGAEILDRPGGELLARVRADGSPPQGRPVMLVQVDEASWSRGHLLVTADVGEAQVQGWVHDAQILEELGFEGLIGFGGFGRSSCGLSVFGEPSAYVPAGTLLSPYEGGPVVARVLQDMDVPASAREEGHLLRRPTPLGEVELWISPADVW
jgi:hypothetical protein